MVNFEQVNAGWVFIIDFEQVNFRSIFFSSLLWNVSRMLISSVNTYLVHWQTYMRELFEKIVNILAYFRQQVPS